MLAHFHYLNQGACPFSIVMGGPKRKKFLQQAGLTAGQMALIESTAKWAENRGESISYSRVPFLTSVVAPMLRNIRETHAFGHDYFWISQLYDVDWKLGPTA